MKKTRTAACLSAADRAGDNRMNWSSSIIMSPALYQQSMV
jgi:hypothetical protein